MASEQLLKAKALEAEQSGEFETAHIMYAMLADKARFACQWDKARYYNNRAGVYLQFADEPASGYREGN